MKIFSWGPVALLLLGSAFSLPAQEAGNSSVVVEFSQPLPPPPPGTLSTVGYRPTTEEMPFREKLPETERRTGSFLEGYDISGKVGKEVSWFGILRRVEIERAEERRLLLVEMRYFDGMTDSHLQVVSCFGAGDFLASVPGLAPEIEPLSLLRVYGRVTAEEDGLPVVAAEYIRVWDWGLFTFMDYGPDNGNPKWRELRKNTDYSSRPSRRYYEDQLGKRDSRPSGSQPAPPAQPADGAAAPKRIIEGKVVEIKTLGPAEEDVIVCHFDPRYAVSIQTPDKLLNLAIHSPAKTFLGTDPRGRLYRFTLQEEGERFTLLAAEDQSSQETGTGIKIQKPPQEATRQ